jgi:hypothetical protein
LRTSTIVNTKETRQGGSAAEVSILKLGLPAAGAIMLGTKFYFVSELLVLLAALAVLFSVVTGVAILFLLAQECSRWSVRKFNEAKQRTILFPGGASFQSSKVDR